MDKKKVIELIKKAETFLHNSKKEGLDYLYDLLTDIEYEVLKPDWISVEDELPPYEEVVWVTSKEDTEEIYFSHRTERSEVIVDKHQFATYKGSEPITHWRKIDKLEV